MDIENTIFKQANIIELAVLSSKRREDAACTLMEVAESLSLTPISRTVKVIVEAYRTGEASTRVAFNLPVLMNTLHDQYQSVIHFISECQGEIADISSDTL